MSFVGRLAGGLLAGYGTGLVNQAKEERDAALKKLDLDEAAKRQSAEIDSRIKLTGMTEEGANNRTAATIAGEDARTDKTIKAGATNLATTEAGANARNAATISGEDRRNQATIDAQKSMIDKVEPDASGEMVVWTKDGKPTKTGITGIPKDMSVGEKAAITLAGTTFVSKDPIEGTKVDRAGMGKFLMDTGKKLGSKALFSMGDAMIGGDGTDSGGMTTVDAPQVAPAKPPGTAKAAEPSSTTITKKPAGLGTPDMPYTASTQEDIDWFKASAPPGTVIMVDGVRYSK